MEISREPAQETVFVVAHGEETDEGNAAWLSVIRTHIERLKQDPHCAQLKAIHAATVREDWPEQREKAVREVREMIQDASKSGRVLIIADRLYGSGPYRTLFEGLNYTLNDKGLAHPVLTQWLKTGIARTASTLMQPIAALHVTTGAASAIEASLHPKGRSHEMPKVQRLHDNRPIAGFLHERVAVALHQLRNSPRRYEVRITGHAINARTGYPKSTVVCRWPRNSAWDRM